MTVKVETKWLSRKAIDAAVAQAVAENKPATALAVRTAKKVAQTARRNLLAGEALSRKKSPPKSRSKGGQSGGGRQTGKPPAISTYRQQVAKEIHYKDLQVKKRQKVAPGTDIPVALTVSDHWASEAFELGNGPDLPVSRFMAAAARSAAGGAVTVRYVR